MCVGGKVLRLDKFLKNTGIIKRRSLAQEVIKGGRVFINGRPAKPSTEVKDGDIIVVNLPKRKVKVKVVGEGGFEILEESR